MRMHNYNWLKKDMDYKVTFFVSLVTAARVRIFGCVDSTRLLVLQLGGSSVVWGCLGSTTIRY